MEFFTILLSSLLTVVSPVSLIIDNIAEDAIRSRLEQVEQLAVRVDNTPSYQLLQGQVERVRIAGRGLFLKPDIRIELLELETDPIHLDLSSLRKSTDSSPQALLEQPFQAGVRLVLTESDLNRALLSPIVTAQLKQLGRRFLGGSQRNYEFLNPRIEFLGENRLSFLLEVQEGNAPPLAVRIESGISLVSGHLVELIEPEILVENDAFPPELVSKLAGSLRDSLDIRTLEGAGIIMRLLELNIGTSELEATAFVRVNSSESAPAASQ
ncbi:MAG: DUF2993 domain-containing protein [Symploca sp. SIO3C6]|uniref:DUF2993 domain-containing protein n=1 Tax=Symploca sp. SIO1C4 TaxID=2607765 RepID=A0A6B3NQE3_9CYAN|nr:DUF2993 domain-containing protein [Symploca sp. SIO3C6]NER31448.1 DUF2993 domain-containing protein [Symploca sp. SIO1C4]NET06485.1 DUF2993 domain-containing protein [Symploca sp. SIO2B6]